MSIDTSVGRVEGVRVSIDTSVQVSGQGSAPYPALALSPVRREGSTGPERPQRRRPDGQECYVESRLAGAKRRRTGKGEETGMPTGRPPGE